MFFLPSEKTEQSFRDQVAQSNKANDEKIFAKQWGNLFCLSFPVNKRNKSIQNFELFSR
jgi:hypothetical protein